jgi:hypothetical protein
MKKVTEVTMIDAVKAAVEVVEKKEVTEKTIKDETMKKRSEVINNLANLEKSWSVLEKQSGKKFPLNWKKLSIRKVASMQPEITTTLNSCKEKLFTELAILNSKLDADELNKMIKDRYDTYLSKEENLIKHAKLEFAIGTDGKINDTNVPLDTLLKAKDINRKKISELNESLKEKQIELELEAISLLKSL